MDWTAKTTGNFQWAGNGPKIKNYAFLVWSDSTTGFQFIFKAQLPLKLFEHTTPLCQYLQTNGMDILQAYKMVQDRPTIDELAK